MTTIEVYTNMGDGAKARLVDALVECRAALLDTQTADQVGGDKSDISLSVLVRVPAERVNDFIRIAGVDWGEPARLAGKI